MLSLAGNTAPYMLYAYARIEGIRRKAAEITQAVVQEDTQDTHFALAAPEELALAKLLIKFEDVLREVEKDLYPSKVRVAE
jgi:arginyl-tRNA synthetase